MAAESSSPKRGPMTSSEGAPLLKNQRIDQRMGVPRTTEVEKVKIWELLGGRGKGKPVEESSEEEEDEGRTAPDRTSKDLVAKKKTTGGATIGKKKSQKGRVPGTKGKKMPPKKVPSKSESGRKYGRRDI